MLCFHIFNIIPGFVRSLQPGGISQRKLLTSPSAPGARESQAGTVLPLIPLTKPSGTLGQEGWRCQLAREETLHRDAPSCPVLSPLTDG